MNWQALTTIIGSTFISFLGLNFCHRLPATAADLQSGWQYSIDAYDDGSGGSGYEIGGVAMTIQDGKFYVGITSGMPITGTDEPNYIDPILLPDGHVGYGDLIFNFSGLNLPNAEGNLFGIRFSDNNDTSVALGIYSSVTTTSVTSSNYGFTSFQQYYDSGHDRVNTQGDRGLPTQADVLNYYGSGMPQTSIGSGTKVGDINLLSTEDLSNLGLDFGTNAGTYTFGFSFDASVVPTGDFMAYFMTECANDALAINSTVGEIVPEPNTILGAIFAMSAGTLLKRVRKTK